MKNSISFAEGFMGPRHDDGVLHTYDHKKAVKIAKEAIKSEPDIVEIRAGLDGDWNCNNDILWKGKFFVPDFYKESCWAKPSLLFIYRDGKEKDGGYCYMDKKFKK